MSVEEERKTVALLRNAGMSTSEAQWSSDGADSAADCRLGKAGARCASYGCHARLINCTSSTGATLCLMDDTNSMCSQQKSKRHITLIHLLSGQHDPTPSSHRLTFQVLFSCALAPRISKPRLQYETPQSESNSLNKLLSTDVGPGIARLDRADQAEPCAGTAGARSASGPPLPFPAGFLLC